MCLYVVCMQACYVITLQPGVSNKTFTVWILWSHVGGNYAEEQLNNFTFKNEPEQKLARRGASGMRVPPFVVESSSVRM